MTESNEDYDKAFTAMIEPLMAAVQSTFNEEEFGKFVAAKKAVEEKMPDPGLKVGSKAPDFTLPDASGSTVTLSKELKEGPVILMFYRGAWCPVCDTHLGEFKKLASTYKEKYNAQIITISPQLTEVSKKMVEEKEYPFKVCSDLDDTVIKEYNLLFTLDSEVAEIYKKFNFQVSADAGGRLSLPVPATFIIDQKGTIRAMQADADYENRMKPAEVTSSLDIIRKDTTGVDCVCFG